MSHGMWGHPRQMGHGGEFWWNMVHWRKHGIQLQYSCLENPMNSSAQSPSHVRHFATPWAAALQASLSITNSRTHDQNPRLMFISYPLPCAFIRLISARRQNRVSLLKAWCKTISASHSKQLKVISCFTNVLHGGKNAEFQKKRWLSLFTFMNNMIISYLLKVSLA